MNQAELLEIQGLYEDADNLIDDKLHMILDYQDYLTLKNATNAMDELIGAVNDDMKFRKRVEYLENIRAEYIKKELEFLADEYLSRPKEFCLDSKCAYYYGEIDECMYGEPEIPANWDKKCEQKGENI